MIKMKIYCPILNTLNYVFLVLNIFGGMHVLLEFAELISYFFQRDYNQKIYLKLELILKFCLQ